MAQLKFFFVVILLAYSASSHATQYYNTPTNALNACLAVSETNSCVNSFIDGQQCYQTGFSPYFCGGGGCAARGLENDGTGLCVEPNDEKTPEECHEGGQYFDQATSTCSDTCDAPNTLLNGNCLTPPPEDQCTSDSSDFAGYKGFGEDASPICTGASMCGEGETYGQFNGAHVCLPPDHGVPTCPSGTFPSFDDYGMSCNSPDSAPEETPNPPDPNTDTNSDGQPDEYQQQNDPASDYQQQQTNKKLDGLDTQLKQLNGTAKKQLNAIDKARKDNNLRLDDIIAKLDEPPTIGEGEKLSDTNLVPTIEQTKQQIANAISSNSAISTVSNIVIPSSSTCPVYTIPSTPISGPLTMDVHCSILSQHSSVISAMFLFAWSMLGLAVFLRA
jgi:hypothetical protein